MIYASVLASTEANNYWKFHPAVNEDTNTILRNNHLLFFFLVLCKEKLICIMHQTESSLPIAPHRCRVLPSSCCSSLDDCMTRSGLLPHSLTPLSLPDRAVSSHATWADSKQQTVVTTQHPTNKIKQISLRAQIYISLVLERLQLFSKQMAQL